MATNDGAAELQLERMQKFLRRWVPGQHHEAAFGDLLEIAKAHAEHGVDMMAETATGRKHDLEILVMVYEATVYCMLPFFKRSPLASLMISQVSCCADAHQKTMKEPAMYAEQVPPYVPKVLNSLCPDCGVLPGQRHVGGCDVERCPRCGWQALSCHCIYEVCGMDVNTLERDHPDIYKHGPTEEMTRKWNEQWGTRDIPWSGEWPGKSECQEFGWYARMLPGKTGWHRCKPTDEGATEDLNRLYVEAEWSQEKQRFVLPAGR